MNGPSRDDQILEKIQRYCEDILFTHNEYKHDYETFCVNPTYRNAIALCLLQIGELVKKLSEEFVQSYSEIPWKSIRGMRNIVAHEYGHIDVDTVWETSEAGVIELKEFCERQLCLTEQTEDVFPKLEL